MTTKDQIKAALEPFLKKEARETGGMADLYRGQEILDLLPKLISELEAKDKALESFSSLGIYLERDSEAFKLMTKIMTDLVESLRAI